MNGATLISATVIVNSSPKKINPNDSIIYGLTTTGATEVEAEAAIAHKKDDDKLNDASDQLNILNNNNNHPINNNDDDTDTESDEEEFIDFDENSAILVSNDSRFSNPDQPSEQVSKFHPLFSFVFQFLVVYFAQCFFSWMSQFFLHKT